LIADGRARLASYLRIEERELELAPELAAGFFFVRRRILEPLDAKPEGSDAGRRRTSADALAWGRSRATRSDAVF
jgi:hypothetical protein